MLRITVRDSADATKAYYTEGLARGDYYAEGQEVAGAWGGKGAERLGLSGPVDREAFAALAENRHPETGERLTLRTKANRVCGWDFNFHVPKSVSLVHAMTGDERILDAFRESVSEAMAEVESEASARVRKAGADGLRRTEAVVTASFTHFTARPVDGVPDPHLHQHVYVFNSTWDAEEGAWKALKLEEIMRAAPYYEALFINSMARRLQDIGYEVVRKGKFFELEGVPKETVEMFSRRTRRIEARAAELGISDDRAKSRLGAQTRERKAKAFEMSRLRELWGERLTPAERAALVELSARARRREREMDRGRLRNPPGAERDAERGAEHGPERYAERNAGRGGGRAARTTEDALWYAIEHCFERRSVAERYRFLEAGLRFGMGWVDAKALKEGAARLTSEGRELLELMSAGRRMLTTPRVLGEERAIVERVRGGIDRCEPLAPDHAPGNPTLTAEQAEAVRFVLESRDRVTGVIGKAGTGKTTLIREAVLGMASASRKAVVLAPTADAAHVVLRREGFEKAETVAMLLASDALREEYRDGVWWVDEAGQLSVRSMLQVLELAERYGARVVLSGDTRQHGSVERGDAFRIMLEHGGLRAASLTRNRRQEGRFREAVDHLGRGKFAEGYRILDELGAIKELPAEAERHRALAREYVAAVEAGESVLVVSPTHAEGRRVTEVLRDELKGQGRIGDERELRTLRRLDLTRAELADQRSYEPGQVVHFQRSAPGFSPGERLTVTRVDPERAVVEVSRPGRERAELDLREVSGALELLQPETIRVGAGDLVRLSKNVKTLDGRFKVTNRSVHRVSGFTPRGDIKLEGGKVLSREVAFLDHGYVLTSQASQGRTVDRCLIAQGSESLGASSQEQAYVSVGRPRRMVSWYVHDKAAVFEACERSSQRMAALDLVREAADDALRKAAAEATREQTGLAAALGTATERDLGADAGGDGAEKTAGRGKAAAPEAAVAEVKVTRVSTGPARRRKGPRERDTGRRKRKSPGRQKEGRSEPGREPAPRQQHQDRDERKGREATTKEQTIAKEQENPREQAGVAERQAREARERELRDSELREREVRDRELREQAAREQAAREQQARQEALERAEALRRQERQREEEREREAELELDRDGP